MKVVGSTAMYPYVAFSPRERLWRGDNRRCLGTASLESRRKGKSKSAKDKLPCPACPCRMMLLKLRRKESCVWQYAGARYFTTTTRQENGEGQLDFVIVVVHTVQCPGKFYTTTTCFELKVTCQYAYLFWARVLPCLRSNTLTQKYIVTFPRRTGYVLLQQLCTSPIPIVIGTSNSGRGYVSCNATSQLEMPYPNVCTCSSNTLGYVTHIMYRKRTVGYSF